MRWKVEKKFKPYLGHERVVEKFLLLPLCIDGEYRWLEKVKILQRYEYTDTWDKWYDKQYVNKKWID